MNNRLHFKKNNPGRLLRMVFDLKNVVDMSVSDKANIVLLIF